MQVTTRPLMAFEIVLTHVLLSSAAIRSRSAILITRIYLVFRLHW